MINVYDIIVDINKRLALGEILEEEEKSEIAAGLLKGVSSREQVYRFHTAMKQKPPLDPMYPYFYIPPYNNGNKLKTFTGVTPGTHILSANAYELEALRLLHLFAQDNAKVQSMVKQTAERLRQTCFGKFCCKGECFEASMVAFRFAATVFPNDKEWVNKLLSGINSHFGDKKRHSGTARYLEICLNESK